LPTPNPLGRKFQENLAHRQDCALAAQAGAQGIEQRGQLDGALATLTIRTRSDSCTAAELGTTTRNAEVEKIECCIE
jgi:hypothetical protein